MRSKFILLVSLAAAARGQGASEPPPPAEREALIAKIKNVALRFRGQLPNFLCTETELRWEDSSGSGKWKLRDTLEVQIAFTHDGHTAAHLEKIDGKPARRPPSGGAVDTEFLHGAILPTHLFAPRPDPQFEWSRWEVLDGRRVAVLAFRAKPVTTVYPDGKHPVLVGFHGVVFADPSDGMPLRLEVQNDYPPPFDQSDWAVGYGEVTISGQTLVLPVTGLTHFRRGKSEWKNEMRFTRYRKFDADSIVTFDN